MCPINANKLPDKLGITSPKGISTIRVNIEGYIGGVLGGYLYYLTESLISYYISKIIHCQMCSLRGKVSDFKVKRG